jgi:hypothetical protein
MTGGLCQVAVGIVGDVPIRVEQEQFGNVGDVGLDQDLRIAGCDGK